MRYYSHLRPLFFSLQPETAHNLAIRGLKYNLLPKQPVMASPRLAQQLFGLTFPNPVGLAPGFDKNAEALNGLMHQGFGFVEIGTVTPKPQSGNPKPRLFRLKEDEAVINRMGFNNDGMEQVAERLQRFKRRHPNFIVGANIGKNKESPNDASDYITGLRGFYPYCDYITVNISSPNTPNLRDMQHKEALSALLSTVMDARNSMDRKKPILLKIAPDMGDEQLDDVLLTAGQYKVDGIIISNTTLSREGLTSSQSRESGGLSGKPLMPLSTAMLRRAYKITNGQIPLIGVGGIASAEDAYRKIRNGASLLQLYSALVYQGFDLVTEIKKGLEERLQQDGFSSIRDAVGIDAI